MVLSFNWPSSKMSRFPFRNLSDDMLNEMGIKLMDDYEDPYYKR